VLNARFRRPRGTLAERTNVDYKMAYNHFFSKKKG
jgi:hypothetical protein